MSTSELKLTDIERNKIIIKYSQNKKHDDLESKIRKNLNFFEDHTNANFMSFRIMTNGSRVMGGIQEWNRCCSVYKVDHGRIIYVFCFDLLANPTNAIACFYDYDKDGNYVLKIKYDLYKEFDKMKEHVNNYSECLLKNHMIIKRKADVTFLNGLNCLWVDCSNNNKCTIRIDSIGTLFLEQEKDQCDEWEIIGKYNSVDELFKNHPYLLRRKFCCIS